MTAKIKCTEIKVATCHEKKSTPITSGICVKNKFCGQCGLVSFFFFYIFLVTHT